MATHTAMTQGNDPELRASLERKVGILHFVSPKEHGWNGVLRKRFTDFQVHEINEDGEVVHLQEFFTNVRDYDRAEAAKHGHALPEKSSSTRNGQPNDTGVTGIASNGELPHTEGSATPADTTKTPASQPVDTTAEPNTASPVVVGLPDTAKKESGQDESTGSIPDTDMTKLKDLLGETTTDELVVLYKKILSDPKARPQTHGLVKFPQISDRSARTAIHSEIRRIFSSKIETETNSDGVIQAKMQPTRGNSKWGNRSDNRNRGNQAGQAGQVKIGKFLHFSLYKENKDTMEAINILAGVLGMKPNFFSTAGTKDRRAVTVQRVSIRGRDPRKLWAANAKLRGLAIGDFKFSDKDLFLGSHNGNEFTIVLKDCLFQGAENAPFQHQLEFAQSTLDQALADITERGFINYFGTQRFGTHEIGTQTIGMKILQGDLKGAVDDLLSFDPSLAATDPNTLQGDNNRMNDIYRAKAMAKYKDNNDPEAAIKTLPRRCNTEFAILKHLSKQPNDFHGAVLSITRNMRNMYLHAYQSLVWNSVASKRWELYGNSVVKGDLVYATADDIITVESNDVDDEENIHLAEADMDGDGPKQSVRALTADDVASGRYSITDVVLSIPGTGVIYPDNDIGEFYKEFMGKEENGALDPHNMHRSQKAFSLNGDYRKLMGTFIGTPSGSVRSYAHDHDQLVPTDLDLIKARQGKERPEAATAAHEQTKAPSEWNSFAQNVQNDERNKAGEKFVTAQRRKAESMEDDAPEVRLNETWVQTSTDGSNKRVKVGATSTKITSNSSVAKHDALDVDQSAVVAQEAEPASSVNTKYSEQEEFSGTVTPEVSTANTCITKGSLSTRFEKVLIKLYNATLGHLFRLFFTDKFALKTYSKPQQSEPAIGAQTQETSNEPTDKQATNAISSEETTANTTTVKAPMENDMQVSNTPANANGSAKQVDTPILPIEEQKIAVILKFSLGSSSYATMVLRELQG